MQHICDGCIDCGVSWSLCRMMTHVAGEDEGYLVTYLTHEETGKTELAVFDAKTMDSKPLATIPIPHRVPAGFHGLHIKVQCTAVDACLTSTP